MRTAPLNRLRASATARPSVLLGRRQPPQRVPGPGAAVIRRRAAERLVTTYDLQPAPGFTAVTPLAVQIGGVARSQHPCEVRYRAR